MLKDWIKKQDEKLDAMIETCQNQFQSIQRQSTSIQRLTDQARQLTENQNYIPEEQFPDDTEEAFEYPEIHNNTSIQEEAEQYQQPDVSVLEPTPAKSLFDFYYADSDSDDEVEMFVPTKVEDGILYPQLEELGSCIAMMFEEELPTTEDKNLQTDIILHPPAEDFGDFFAQLFDEELPESSNPAISEDEDLMLDTSLHPQADNYEACISQMTDEELNAELLKYICEEKVKQEAEQMEE